jgi:hypothetical protein
MKMNIHNQCLYFKLTNGNLVDTLVNWNMTPKVEVDAGKMTSGVLTSCCAVFEVSLTYRLQKRHFKFDDEPTYTLLFVTWKLEGYKVLHAYMHLIECDKQIKWNSYKLKEYCQRYHSQLDTYTDPIKDTWLIHDDTVLMTRLELDFTQSYGVLKITISERIKDGHTKREKNKALIIRKT